VSWPLIVVFVVAGIVATFWTLHLVWRLHGVWRIRRAGPRPLLATRHRIWHGVDRDEATDLRFGPGGESYVPTPPLEFVEELLSGSHPCVSVRDAKQRLWRVKWGAEAKPETFCVRFAAACGYFAEVTHYVATGRIDGVTTLTRARGSVGEGGTFSDARFELEDRSVRMLFDEYSWAWNDNPFVGTKQLDGLKIVVMLLSNWDTKDRRDVSRGSNTAIFEYRVSRFASEARYLMIDWGGAMGKWGTTVVSRSRWDVDGFEAQTPAFVSAVHDEVVDFGYQGQRTAEIAHGIPVDHVRWFYKRARRITEPALREGLLVSGATEDEAIRFARALVTRIQALHKAVVLSESREARPDEGRRTIQTA
jgi:hypothetical protein